MAGTLDPSPQRRALARRAGVVPSSAAFASAGAWAGATIAMVAFGGAAAGALAAWASRALSSAPAPGAIARAGGVSIVDVIDATAQLAAPIVLAAAAAALIAHAALVRGAWMPRRRVRGAPAIAPRRAADAAMALARGAIVLAVALRFAIAHLGDAARLGGWGAGGSLASRGGGGMDAHGAAAGGASAALALLGAALAHVAIAIALVGALDALERARRWRTDLRMTPRERRDEDRAQHGDPRWRAARRRAAREPAAALAIRDAALVVVGDRAAVAIRWHPRAHPVPTVIARGQGARAAQLVALARRHAVPAVHAPALAADLARIPVDTPVPACHHAALTAALRP